MRPLVRPYTDPAGGQWFVTCAVFANDRLGLAAFRHVNDNTPVGDAGVYRHDEPGGRGRYISAVSVKRADILRIARLLSQRAGVDHQLPDLTIERMCIRRAIVVTEAQAANAPTGRFKIHHPGAGAHINADGTMDETAKGQG
jgi:hypothetical protein